MLHYLMTALSVACLSLAVAAAGLHEPSADYTVRFSAEARWTEPGPVSYTHLTLPTMAVV